MATQETSNTRMTSIYWRLGGRIARVAFYSISVVLLLACIVAWVFSYAGGYYNYDIHWYALHHNDKSAIFSERYVSILFMDGEAVIEIGTNLWDGAPNVPWSSLKVVGGHVLDPADFRLPEKGWRQFRYGAYAEGPDSLNKSLGDSFTSLAFPFWSALAVLLMPFLIGVMRRTLRHLRERRPGFLAVVKQQLDDAEANVDDLSREHR